MSSYDIAVIGAGPAGSVAALMLARAGLHVVLLGANPGSAPARGETLSAAIMQILCRLKLSEQVEIHRMPRVTGFASRWGSAIEVLRPAFVIPDAYATLVDRAAFDTALQNAASVSGAEVSSRRVVSLRTVGDFWRLHMQCGSVISARFVIDASGRGGRFARRAGSRVRVFDKLVAVSVLLPPREADNDRCVVIETMAKGWLFSALDGNQRRVINFFTDGDLWANGELKRPRDLLERTLAEADTKKWIKVMGDQPVRIWSAGTLVLDHAVWPRFLAVGDAAQTYDPLSSQGILSAIEDAADGATIVAADFEQDLAVPMQEHELRRRRRFDQYLRNRSMYYRAETRWAEHPFWARRHTSPPAAQQEFEPGQDRHEKPLSRVRGR